MPHKFDDSNKHKLDNEWRRQNLPPYETLQELGLIESDIVADIGCGIGYFTLPISETIKPANKVYALDTSEKMLFEVEKRARFSEVKNIITLKTDEYDLKLRDNMVSFSLLVNVLHEVEDKEKFINEIKRITKQTGKIAIIEWEKKQTTMGPSVVDRLDKNEIKVLLETLGFEMVKETAFADCFYGIVAELK
jgi:ubiquinone/menaquinone biosynthesis C-methylase UbiE